VRVRAVDAIGSSIINRAEPSPLPSPGIPGEGKKDAPLFVTLDAQPAGLRRRRKRTISTLHTILFRRILIAKCS
jgi:hypothetical protein